MKIEFNKDLVGTILDVGGGGAGIIGRLYTNQVIAIDNRQDELDEAPDCCTKILMDATDLKFESNAFDHVTFFYTLMYMNRDIQKRSLSEAYRVLRPNGTLWIWDVEMSSAYPDPFITHLDVFCGRMEVHVTYGVVNKDGHSLRSIEDILDSCGFQHVHSRIAQGHFCIQGQKPSCCQSRHPG